MRIKRFNEINEGWKENLLVSLSLLLSTPSFSQKSNIDKTDQKEQSIDYNKDFWRACFQLCEELKSPKMSLEERAGILEAQIHFQAKRDGTSPKKMSEKGEITAKIIMEKVSKLSNDQIDILVQKGSSGNISGSITGL